jgi:antirestriction protein
MPIQQLTLNYLGLAGTALRLLIGPGESQERRSAMQLKVSVPTAHNSIPEYSIVVACNKCAGLHEMGICVTIPNGPVEKQSVGDLYVGKSLPKSLADLPNTSISCPKTGRQSTQKNLHQIFLVPTTNNSPKRRPKSEN